MLFIYTCIHHIYIHIHIHIQFIYIYVYIYIYRYTLFICTCKGIHRSSYTYTYTYTCTDTFYSNIHVFIHIYTYMNIHTYTCCKVRPRASIVIVTSFAANSQCIHAWEFSVLQCVAMCCSVLQWFDFWGWPCVEEHVLRTCLSILILQSACIQ